MEDYIKGELSGGESPKHTFSNLIFCCCCPLHTSTHAMYYCH